MQATYERPYMAIISKESDCDAFARKLSEAKRMINELYKVFDRKSLAMIFRSMGINIKRLKSLCKDYNKFNELLIFYQAEMLGLNKDRFRIISKVRMGNKMPSDFISSSQRVF